MPNSSQEVWCTSCGCLMKLREGKFGSFYGCTGYPICRNTRSLRDLALELKNFDPNEDAVDRALYKRW